MMRRSRNPCPTRSRPRGPRVRRRRDRRGRRRLVGGGTRVARSSRSCEQQGAYRSKRDGRPQYYSVNRVPPPLARPRIHNRYLSATGHRRRDAALGQGRLRRRQPRERHRGRRARHVVEPDRMAEVHRRAGLPRARRRCRASGRASRPPPLHRDAHRVADAAFVERFEQVALEHVVLEVAGEELALGIVEENRARSGEVVRAEGEKSACSATSSARTHARGARSSCRRGGRGRLPRGDVNGQLAGRRSSSPKAISGCMISTIGASPVRLIRPARRARSRAPASRRSRGRSAPPATAHAEHRVRLLEDADALAHVVVGLASSSGGRNSCSGGSSSRIVTGSPSIAWKIPSKSPAASGGSARARNGDPPSSRP